MRRAALLLLALLWAAPLGATESIVAGLSQSRVAITANFDGSEILIYGAVKREEPTPEGPPLQMIITVEGPEAPLVIRRKERVAGIWINQDSVRISAAPSYYAIATTGALGDILSATEDLRHNISIPRVIRAVGISAEADNSRDFVDALIRVRLADDAYRLSERTISLVDQTLFRTDFVLPANLIEGDYKVRMFLIRDRKVVDMQQRLIGVRKTGLERFLFVMAHDQPLLYGLISLLLAALAGWAASAGFKLLRR